MSKIKTFPRSIQRKFLNRNYLSSSLQSFWLKNFYLCKICNEIFKKTKMLMVEKCCCCIKLTTGGLILGYIQLVYHIIIIVVDTFVIVKYDDIVQVMNETDLPRSEMMIENKSGMFELFDSY